MIEHLSLAHHAPDTHIQEIPSTMLQSNIFEACKMASGMLDHAVRGDLSISIINSCNISRKDLILPRRCFLSLHWESYFTKLSWKENPTANMNEERNWGKKGHTDVDGMWCKSWCWGRYRTFHYFSLSRSSSTECDIFCENSELIQVP